MSDDYLNYEKLVEDALRTVVREALKGVSSQGVPAGHHLYISFRTQTDGVQISENLRTQFPDEMTIVLENQFWDLKVDDDQFRVTLNFNKVPQELVVPLSAISRFTDQRAKSSGVIRDLPEMFPIGVLKEIAGWPVRDRWGAVKRGVKTADDRHVNT